MKCPMKFASDDKMKICERDACAWWTIRKDIDTGKLLAKGCALAFSNMPALVGGILGVTNDK